MPAAKQGLDWFPFDVDLLDDESLDFLREKYGVVVNDIYISLLTLLYRKKGYYVPYETEKEKIDCVWYIYKRVRGGKYPIQQEAIPTVIEACVARQLFSGELYPKIITSERAQRTYYSATVERKLESFDIKSEYWLLDDATMRKLSKKHPYYLFLHKNDISDETKSISGEIQVKSDEITLDKSRVNITSNEVIKVSKKDKEIKNNNGILTRAHLRKSYKEVMDSHDIPERVQLEIWKFIQHCQANGQIVTNSRLQSLWFKLKKIYRPSDEGGMVQALRTAIDRGYYDIKDGEDWMATSIKAMRAAGAKLYDVKDDNADEEVDNNG